MKWLLVVGIVSIILISGCVASTRTLQQAPEQYEGKEMTIEGFSEPAVMILVEARVGELWSVSDSQGYTFLVKPLDPKNNPPGHSYRMTGTVTSAEICSCTNVFTNISLGTRTKDDCDRLDKMECRKTRELYYLEVTEPMEKL